MPSRADAIIRVHLATRSLPSTPDIAQVGHGGQTVEQGGQAASTEGVRVVAGTGFGPERSVSLVRQFGCVALGAIQTRFLLRYLVGWYSMMTCVISPRSPQYRSRPMCRPRSTGRCCATSSMDSPG
jgi:hypothetical protein